MKKILIVIGAIFSIIVIIIGLRVTVACVKDILMNGVAGSIKKDDNYNNINKWLKLNEVLFPKNVENSKVDDFFALKRTYMLTNSYYVYLDYNCDDNYDAIINDLNKYKNTYHEWIYTDKMFDEPAYFLYDQYYHIEIVVPNEKTRNIKYVYIENPIAFRREKYIKEVLDYMDKKEKIGDYKPSYEDALIRFFVDE